MKKYVVMIIFLLSVSAVFFSVDTISNEPEAVKIVEKMESITNIEDGDFELAATMLQKKTGEPDKMYKIKWYRRDSDDAFVILFLYPDSEKGKGYLRLGDNLYMYMPSTREFVHKNRKETIGSTDASAEDFEEKKTLELYWVKKLPNETVNKKDCFVIELTAKEQDVSYPIKKWYISISDYLMLKAESYSFSRTLMEVTYFVKYLSIGNGRMIFSKMMTEDKLEKSRTWVEMDEKSLSLKKLPDYIFTKAFLEQQSK